jgi:RNA polymerase sigma-70 factor (ECF subfamily)
MTIEYANRFLARSSATKDVLIFLAPALRNCENLVSFSMSRDIPMRDSVELRTSATLLEQVRAYDTGRGYLHQDAWRRFIEKYRPLIHAWCRRRALQEADVDEVTGRVLLALARHMKQFVYDPRKRFRGWLKAVVDNELNRRRRTMCRRPGDDAFGGEVSSAAIAQMVQEDAYHDLAESLEPVLESERQLVAKAVRIVQEEVDPCHWRAFYRAAIDGEKGTDVAAALGISASSVYQARHRVAEKLRATVARLQTDKGAK